MDKMKIAFYIGKSRENPRVRIWDRIVCFVDGSRYSHAELVLVEYADGTCLCASSSARDHGVRYKRMKLDPVHWDLVEIYGDLRHAHRWMNARTGRKYDWLGLIRTMFGWMPDDQKRYFCSESVAGMLGLEDPARYGLKKLFKAANTRLNQPWVETDLPDVTITDSH